MDDDGVLRGGTLKQTQVCSEVVGAVTIPSTPKIYHITHVNNLPGILQAGRLWSDAQRINQDLACQLVGMPDIKQRRLERQVHCHPGTMVGEYVPFYFCPRSVMLYLLNQRNHPGLNYQGGQQPIIHLQADLHQVVNWAQSNGARWAFSDSNAGSRYAQFYNRLADLKEVDWKAVPAQYWSDPATKEGKQAEFLLHEFFPWELVEEIGVINSVIQAQAHQALSGSAGVPPVVVKRNWYY